MSAIDRAIKEVSALEKDNIRLEAENIRLRYCVLLAEEFLDSFAVDLVKVMMEEYTMQDFFDSAVRQSSELSNKLVEVHRGDYKPHKQS